jgi:hypothetical protein
MDEANQHPPRDERSSRSDDRAQQRKIGRAAAPHIRIVPGNDMIRQSTNALYMVGDIRAKKFSGNRA